MVVVQVEKNLEHLSKQKSTWTTTKTVDYNCNNDHNNGHNHNHNYNNHYDKPSRLFFFFLYALLNFLF